MLIIEGIITLYIIGLAAFALFFLNDYNDWKLEKKYLKACFPMGIALLILSTVLMCIYGNGQVFIPLGLRIIIWIICLLTLAAEVYSLFFSFDPGEAYGGNSSGNERKATTTRMYALCRHPGVLFFIILYAGLWLVTNMSLGGAVMLSGLNVLLIIFEDLRVFPAILAGYDEYKGYTPFLIPNKSSISKCVKDFRKQS